MFNTKINTKILLIAISLSIIFGFTNISFATVSSESKTYISGISGPTDIIKSSTGDQYIVGNQCIQKTTSTGVLSLIAGVCGTYGYQEAIGVGARFYNPTNIVLDETNNILYVSDYNNNRVRKIDLTTNTTSLVIGNGSSTYAEGTGSTAGIYNPRGLALSQDKQFLYVVEQGNNRVRKIDLTTNTTSLVAGNGSSSTIDGAGYSATFYSPYDIVIDYNKNVLYVSQGGGNDVVYQIRKIDLSNNNVTSIYGNYQGSSASYNRYGSAMSISLDSTRNLLYILYGGTRRSSTYVVRLDLNTNIGTNISGSSIAGGYIDGIGDVVRYGVNNNRDSGILYDSGSNMLYIADKANNAVRTLDVANYSLPDVGANQKTYLGAALSTGTIINDSRSVLLSFDITPTEYRQYSIIEAEIKPIGTSFDGSGTLYSKTMSLSSGSIINNSIIVGKPDLNLNTNYHWRYRIKNIYSGQTGSWNSFGGNTESDIDFGIGLRGSYSQTKVGTINNEYSYQVSDIIKSSTGDQYIVGNQCIQKTTSTGVLSLIAGVCGTSYGYQEGTGIGARFYNPTNIVLDETNNILYVSDYDNNRIRKIDLATNTTSLVAGNGSSTYAEGTGSTAGIYNPRGLALSQDKQSLYVVERNSYRVRKIDLTTNATSLVAGNGTAGTTDGIGAAAKFYIPFDLAIDYNKNILYVSQGGGNDVVYQIRKIDLSNNNVTSIYGNYQGSSASYNRYGSAMSISLDSTRNLLYILYGGTRRSSTYVVRLDLNTNIGTNISGSSIAGGYIDGIGDVVRYGISNNQDSGILYDSGSNMLYIADKANNAVRTLDVANYSLPDVSELIIYDVNNVINTTGSGINGNIANIYFKLNNNENVNFTNIEFEIKKIGTNFDGLGTTVLNNVVTSSGITGKLYQIGSPLIDYNNSYHIRYRSITNDGLTNGWINYLGNTEDTPDLIINQSVNTQTSSLPDNDSSYYRVQDIVKSSSGDIYSARNQCIQKTNSVGQTSLIAGKCGTYGYSEGAGSSALFYDDLNIALDETNNILYVSDYGNNRVRKINLTTNTTSLVIGNGSSTYAEGIGSAATIYNPRGLVLSQDKQSLYVAELSNNRVRKIDLTTNTTSTIAGNGTYETIDGIGASSYLRSPDDLIIDYKNNALYFNERGGYYAIRKIDLNNNRVSSIYQINGNYRNYGLSLDSINNLLYTTYRSSNGGSFIGRLDLTTNWMTWISGNGSLNGYLEGTTTSSKYSSDIRRLFIDSSINTLYIADYGNNKIRTVDLNNYLNPSVSAMQLYNIEDDALSLGGTLRTKGLKLSTTVRDLDGTDRVQSEIEVKKITEAFNGTGTYIVPSIGTTKGNDSTSKFIINGDNLELGSSYHIRIRAIDQGGISSSRSYYGGNLDLGKDGATYSDADFIVPITDSSYFQTEYISGNGQYNYDALSTQDKYSIKTGNLGLGSPRYLEKDAVGNIYFVDNNPGVPAIKKISSAFPYNISLIGNFMSFQAMAIDRLNSIMYVTNGNTIYKIDLSNPTTGFIYITGGNGVGYVNGYPEEVKFNGIKDLAVSNDGKILYVADYSNNRIRKVNLDGTTSDYLSTSLLIGGGIASDLEGVYEGASIKNPNALEISQDDKYLFVGNNGYLYKINTLENKSLIMRSGYGQINYITRDRTGDYVYIYDSNNKIRKINTDYLYKTGDADIILAGTYSEGITTGGIGKFYNNINGIVEQGGKLFFIDSSSRIRSIIIPNASDNSVVPTTPLSALQKESDNSTTVSIGGITKSQTMYLGINMRHPYNFTHIRPEIDIKPIGEDFDSSSTPSGTIMGPYRYYIGTDVNANVLITKDILKPSTAYHWRARVVDLYGNKGPWAYANSNPESTPDFETGPTGVGQTNLIMGTLSAGEATGFFPLIQLPSFNYSLIDKDAFDNINKIYFVASSCLQYFDYANYRQNNKPYGDFIKTVSCNGIFANVNGKLKFTKDKNSIIFHTAVQVYKYELSTGAFTHLAGQGTSGYLDGLPTSSYFNNITDVVILQNIDPYYDEKCMLVAESGNADIRMVPLNGAGYNCKGIVGTDNGYVEKWKDIASISCLYQTKDTTRMYTNGGVISIADRIFSSISTLPCINDSISSDESTMYYFSSYNIYSTNIATHPTSISKISGKSTSGYIEGDQNNALFSSVNTIIYDPSYNSLFVNDSGKFREIFLNTNTPPIINSLSTNSGKSGDSITITGSNFGSDPGYPNRSSQNYSVLFNGTQASVDDFVSWTDSGIVVKVPEGATTGQIRVKNIYGMSNGKDFTVTNAPMINYIMPTSAKIGQVVQIYGKYFGTKGTGSYVHFPNGSGSYIAANIIGWADGLINVTVPTGANTGKMKVITLYGDSNLVDFTLVTGTPPNKPIPTSPINGALQQPLNPTFTTQDFIDADNDSHTASWWEVRENTQTYSNPVYTSGIDTLNKTMLTVPSNGMKYNTTYYWRVKFQDSRGDWSDRSDQYQFKTSDGGGDSNNLPPIKPINTSPLNDAQDIDNTNSVTLSASNFIDGETAQGLTGATLQESSAWQVRDFAGMYSTSIFEKLITSSPLNSVSIPANTLLSNRTYCWHVTYKDSGGSNSAYSNETCFKTKGGTTQNNNTSGGSTGSGGTYYIQSYDAPLVPSNFTINNNAANYTVGLLSNDYIDSNADSFVGDSDKLEAVEWQILLFSGSTGINLTTDGNGFITDTGINGISFGNAKKYRELRENCVISGGDNTCILSKNINYNDIGGIGTYLVRVRHMDQYSTRGDFSGIKKLEIISNANTGLYVGKLRSVASLSVNIISGGSPNFSYTWTGTTSSGLGKITAISGGKCGTKNVDSMYGIYSYCLYNEGTSDIYGYISGAYSDVLKFEPLKLGTYNFTIQVKDKVSGKTQTKIIPVTVK